MSYNITTVDMYDMTIQLERMSYNITTVEMYDMTIQLERNDDNPPNLCAEYVCIL